MFGDQPWRTCYIIMYRKFRFKPSKYAIWEKMLNEIVVFNNAFGIHRENR